MRPPQAADDLANDLRPSKSDDLVFASLMADNAAEFCKDLAGYLARRSIFQHRLIVDVTLRGVATLP